jgi:Ni,Fe-hydrogenase I large subunit
MASHPAVNGIVSRHGRGVAARLAARVADVARTVDALANGSRPARVDAWSTADGTGVAIVETARGLLLHGAEVRDARVTRYGIVAPTEWNFQPGGPLERSLAGLDARDAAALRRDAALVVQSLDPCVACRVEVSDA